MPEISRFYGIIIRICMEAGGPHHQPHFHAYYGGDVAIYTLSSIELIVGSLLRRQQRLVEAWAELHQNELMANWHSLQSGQSSTSIDALS